MHTLLLLNRAAGSVGTGAATAVSDRLLSLFRAAGLSADVAALPGHQLGECARQAAASSAELVVAAGGDGTVSTVAAALAGTDTPLGVLPMGTLNHFARDLGLPGKVEDAVRVLATGVPRRVDVGEVNGHVFINNSSLGFYPRLVRERDERQARGRLPKWRAFALACLSVLRRHPLVTVRLATGAATQQVTTPLLFVGNNRYETDLLAVRRRSALDGAELCLYLVKGRGRFTLLRLAVLGLLGRLEQDRDFQGLCLPAFRVESRRRRLAVALDGELRQLRPPLDYRVRVGALRVMSPRPAGG